MAYVTVATRLALGCVFLVSAAGKLRSREAFGAFRLSLRQLGVVPRRLVTAVAGLTAAAEAAVVVMLLAGPTAAAGFVLATLLLALFSTAIAAALRRGARAPCRCFGRSSRPLGAPHLVRNAVLLAVAVTGAVGAVTAPAAAGAHPGGVAVAAAAGLLLAGLVVVFDDLADLLAGPAPGGARPPQAGARGRPPTGTL